MGALLLGRKVGMTRFFREDGKNVPVTIIRIGPCHVSQLKSTQPRQHGKHDGYTAVQLAFDEVKPRNSTMPVIGHDAKAGLPPSRVHREFHVTPEELANFKLGQEVTLDSFDAIKFVDIIGTSKGKGFAGPMKRHNFKGLCASHGTERKHRSPGSQAAHATNRGWSGRPKKGKRMGGHLGDEQMTQRSVEVVKSDKEKGLLLVKGAVPGANGGLVEIRPAKRLWRQKARASTATAPEVKGKAAKAS